MHEEVTVPIGKAIAKSTSIGCGKQSCPLTYFSSKAQIVVFGIMFGAGRSGLLKTTTSSAQAKQKGSLPRENV